MARDFTQDTNNFLSLGTATINALLSGAAKISLAAWASFDTLTTATGDNNVFQSKINAGSAGLLLRVDQVTPKIQVAGRSQTADAASSCGGSTTITTGTWWHLGGVLNLTANTVTVYVNGASDGSAGGGFGASTYTPGTPSSTDRIGSNAGGAANTSVDGQIAEVAIWVDDIGAAGFATLGKGISPLLVRPEALALYMPLIGNFSPEIDLISGSQGAITGTVPAAPHCRVYNPANTFKFGKAAAVAAGASAPGRNPGSRLLMGMG